jgi:hypothetical protein
MKKIKHYKNSKVMGISIYLSIITLNVNGLRSLVRMAGIKKTKHADKNTREKELFSTISEDVN